MPIAVLKIMKKMMIAMITPSTGLMSSIIASIGTSLPWTVSMFRYRVIAAMISIAVYSTPPISPPMPASFGDE